MVKFDKEELLNIAKLSALELDAQEIELFEDQIAKILNFAEQLQQVDATAEANPIQNTNILREDKVQQSDAGTILAQAPQQEIGYFVVPKILD
ncbi:MAG: Asp-tRNA(Asn)/Glu-tRNA(Gln) amidotransferase subunit GatC [bacterium]